jgi:hypothetical protein
MSLGDGRIPVELMTRLLIHVEGQTEEDFVNELLRGHLMAKGYHSVAARILGSGRQRGGIGNWPDARTEIRNHLLEDSGSVATTMVDYYGLPQTWPGRDKSKALNAIEKKARCVQDAVRKDLIKEMGRRFDSNRFVPFVVMYEFEGLLFSDSDAFSQGINQPALAVRFQRIREKFETPEHINDSPVTAPSKRVEALVYGYQKPLHGVLAALEIGLARIRKECPHFDGWIKQLEELILVHDK